jgi:ABC-type transport system involved in multi-copper enzyme maturation permease subunit
MTSWPVIHRELCGEARHSWTYWSRVLGAGAVLVVWFGTAWGQPTNPAQWGSHLFGTLNATLFALIWLVVPVLAADCISRERREGTLGLLFLTSLTGSAIVVGKSIMHGLRGLAVLLAAVPVMAFPFLVGGISGVDIVTALGFDLTALFLALSAGLLASSSASNGRRS